MLKKILVINGIFFGCLSHAFAASLYIAPMISYIDIKSDDPAVFQGLVPKISVGYGNIVFNPFFIAIEAFAIPLKPLTIHSNADVTSVRPGYSYGASLLGGIDLDGIINIYARGGFIYTNFNPAGTTKFGAQLGVGAQFNIYGPWSGRFEYINTTYQSFGGLGSIHAQEGSAGLVYCFGI